MSNPNLPIAGNYNTYIGARYVPLVLGAWSETVAYEPLSIVTYQGNSYTSKTFVPAGTPLTNETYWTLTGNYNAQVEQYRQEVTTVSTGLESTNQTVSSIQEDITGIQNDITSVEGNISTIQSDITSLESQIDNIKVDDAITPVLIIGDSFFITETNAGTYLSNKMGWSGNDNTILAAGGHGFGGTYPFVSDLQSFIADNPTRTFNTIIVLGGTNDNGSDQSLASQTAALFNLAHTKYPKAKLYAGFTGSAWTVNPNTYTWGQTIKDAWTNAGGLWLNTMGNALRVPNAVNADGTHPSDAGNRELADYLYNYLNGLPISSNNFTNYPLGGAAEGTTVSSYNMVYNLHDNVIMCNGSIQGTVATLSGDNITIGVAGQLPFLGLSIPAYALVENQLFMGTFYIPNSPTGNIDFYSPTLHNVTNKSNVNFVIWVIGCYSFLTF